MTLLAEHIEETYRTTLEHWVFNTEFGQSFLDESTHLTRLRDARQVAFHICHETGHTCLTERFGHYL